VYVSGQIVDQTTLKKVAVYWKNGQEIRLTNGQYDADTRSITVFDGAVYVAGVHNYKAVYWKNGREVVLTKNDQGEAMSIVVLAGSGLPAVDDAPMSQKKEEPVKPRVPVAIKPAGPAVTGLTLKQEAEKFLAENKKKPGVLSTPSGLQYEILGQGAGPKPGANDKVRFIATRTDMVGAQVKASAQLSPNPMVVSYLMPGLVEGMQLMNVGSKYKFTLPPKLNMLVSPPNYPEGAVIMVWEVELLEIVK
jgi:FKBP-type peptidyl-prolyl cis-trans isomerase